ncbi:hypothetical protein D3C85_1886030 [compost metagenome]
MNTLALGPEVQKGRAVQQACKVQRRVIVQQFHVEHKGFADRFTTGKHQDLKGVGQTRYIQTK